MRQNIVRGLLLAPALAGMAASTASAQQALSLNVGYFAVRGEDARVESDVLNVNRNFLAFDLKDFNNVSVGAEWLVPIGDYLEAGVGLGFYRRTVPSVYAHFVNRDGSEIEQDLKLRIVPVTATVRVLPLGRHGGIQPYLGAGVGLYTWRYSETGEFVDLRDNTIFRDRFIAEGTGSGPLVLGGLRVPVGSRVAAGGELRYQRARGALDDQFEGERIDLGGYTYQASVQVRF